MDPTETADDDLGQALEFVLSGVSGESVSVRSVDRLTGGASRETYAVAARRGEADWPLILQRNRPGSELAQERGMAAEAEVFTRAHRAGVPTPVIVATNEDGPDTAIGPSYMITEVVAGETIARRILRDDRFETARAVMAGQAGRALAALHATDVSGLPQVELVDQLATYRERADELEIVSPVFELAFRWLAQHPPTRGEPALVHGDFRIGNLLVDETGLVAVIDWELAHLGQPMEDLGWLCTRAWRFGGPNPVGGFGSYEDLLEGYSEASGRVIDQGELAWWELLGTLKWGIMCAAQAEVHRSGLASSLEHLAIGNRMAEQEYDLTQSIVRHESTQAQVAAPDLSDLATSEDARRGQPDAAELGDALAEFLNETVRPELDGPLGFHVRVAANVVAVLAREAQAGAGQRERHRQRLDQLGVSGDDDLARQIRSGALDDRLGTIAAVLATSATERLAIVNPRWIDPEGV